MDLARHHAETKREPWLKIAGGMEIWRHVIEYVQLGQAVHNNHASDFNRDKTGCVPHN